LRKQSKEKTQLPVEPTRLPKNSPNRKAKPNQWKGKKGGGEEHERETRRMTRKRGKKVKGSERKKNKIMIDV